MTATDPLQSFGKKKRILTTDLRSSLSGTFAVNSRHLQVAIQNGEAIEVFQAMNVLTDSVSNSADFVEYAYYLTDNFNWFRRDAGAIQENEFVERVAAEIRERIGLAEVQADIPSIEWNVLAQILYSTVLRE